MRDIASMTATRQAVNFAETGGNMDKAITAGENGNKKILRGGAEDNLIAMERGREQSNPRVAL